jgi:hypothetical protein
LPRAAWTRQWRNARALRQWDAQGRRGGAGRSYCRGSAFPADTLKNGELLSAAEAAGFEVFVTTDRNIVHQQNLRGRRIAIVILSKGRWKLIKLKFADIQAAVATATPGAVVQVDI